MGRELATFAAATYLHVTDGEYNVFVVEGMVDNLTLNATGEVIAFVGGGRRGRRHVRGRGRDALGHRDRRGLRRAGRAIWLAGTRCLPYISRTGSLLVYGELRRQPHIRVDRAGGDTLAEGDYVVRKDGSAGRATAAGRRGAGRQRFFAVIEAQGPLHRARRGRRAPGG